jgi:hypothetical protein
VIYSFENQVVISIDKDPSLSSFTINLSNWGLANFDTFDCMSRIGMFALSSVENRQGDTKFNYGLFFGNEEYNADKYVNVVLNDLKYEDWIGTRSYPLRDMVMTIGFSRTSGGSKVNYNTEYNTIGTLIRPPMIFSRVGFMDTKFDATKTYQVSIGVKAGLNKAVETHDITTVRENVVIQFSNTSKYDGRSGWINLESFTRILGPVQTVKITPTKQDIPPLSLRNRQWFRGSMSTAKNDLEFDIYQGDIHNAVALSDSENGETFAIITEHEVVGTF